MATPFVQCPDLTGLGQSLLSGIGGPNMKPNKQDKDIPLGINAKGSLIELAHKLKWAHKHFGNKPSDAAVTSSENELHHGKVSKHHGPWLNGAMDEDNIYDPDEYVIQGMYSEGRPHPLLAYGESLFLNALQGEPCSYTSLGTVHNFNGARNDPLTNGFLPLSAALAVNESFQQAEAQTQRMSADVDTTTEAKVPPQTDTNGENRDFAICHVPESKHVAIEQFLEEHREVLSVLPSMSGVVGPSLWRLLTATKEIREVDHDEILQAFQLEEEEEEGKENNDEVPMELTEATAEDPASVNVSASQASGVTANGTDSATTTHNIRDSKSLVVSIRDKLTTPLNELETSAICSSAVDFVVRHKVPMRVLTQLYAMQTRHRREQQEVHNQPKSDSKVLTKASDGCMRKYQCPNCAYQTDNKSHLRRHVSSVHFIGMPYYCYICSKEFPRSEKVKAHFTKVHPEVNYDHRLVRKDKFFGVDYSPENTPKKDMKNQESFSAKSSPSIKLTPKNMRTLGNTTPVKAKSSGEVGNNSSMSDDLPNRPGANSSVTPGSSQEDRKPIWKSASKTDGERRFFCPECPYTGKDIWHLKRHFNDVHQQNKDLKCPLCNYSTGRKHRLVSHMKNHGQLFCFHCDFSTQDFITFQSHVKVCSMAQRRSQHQCCRCNRPCSNRKQLQDHQFREHGAVLFCCDKCMFYSEDNNDYQQHLQLHQERQEHGYVCQVCSRVLDDYKALRQHLSTHKQPNMVSPAICHQNKSPKKELSPKYEPLLELECPSCDFKSPDAQVMTEHKAVHDSEKLYCDVNGCDFDTVWPLSLEHHKKIKHLASPSSLEKSAATAAATAAATPAASPATPKPQGKGTFMCPVCKDNRPPFRYKRSFNKHMAQHKEDEEKCPLCAEVFYFRASLKQHLKHQHQAKVIEVSSSEDSSSDEEDQGAATTSISLQRGEHGTWQLSPGGAYGHGGMRPGPSPSKLEPSARPLSQGAAMEAYGPGAVMHGSMAPFL